MTAGSNHGQPDCVLRAAAGSLALVVELQRTDDRVGHSVYVERDGTRTLWLTSCEGNAEEDWPASPPLQQMLLEERATGPIALLVGMAGRSHWSLSIESRDGSFLFDVACRATQRPTQLGSQYQVVNRILDVDVVTEQTCERGDNVVSIQPSVDAEPPHTYQWQYKLMSLANV